MYTSQGSSLSLATLGFEMNAFGVQDNKCNFRLEVASVEVILECLLGDHFSLSTLGVAFLESGNPGTRFEFKARFQQHEFQGTDGPQHIKRIGISHVA